MNAQDLKRILNSSSRIAVLGAHTHPGKAANWVPEYLVSQGYEIFPVNPVFAGEAMWDQPVVAHLDQLPGPVDMVLVFRRSEHLADHLPAILAMDPLPAVVWMQSGIRDDSVAAQLEAAGIEVVQDRCTYAEHHRLGLSEG
jgi:predicted CoA-binding protein